MTVERQDLIVRADSPGHYDHLLRRGHAVPVLVGVARPVATADGFETRVRAVGLRAPTSVLRGATAAQLTWWRELEGDAVEVSDCRLRQVPPWLTVTRSPAPRDALAMWRGLRVVTPAFSALDMVREWGKKPIHEVLRRGASTVGELRDAAELLSHRSGTTDLRRMLSQTAQGPWSELEDAAHQRLRRARLEGWVANARIVIKGVRLHPDIALPAWRIAAELDGLAHHSSAADLIRDHERQNRLVLAGWIVLRYSWHTIDDLVDGLNAAIRLRLRTGWRSG